MAAAAQVCRLMGISSLGLVVLQGLVECLVIGTGHRLSSGIAGSADSGRVICPNFNV
jgi:hypothetical protein